MSDIIVIGGGPAGVSAAVYAARAGMNVNMIKKDGGALEKADLIENYYGLTEPISGQELIKRGISQARRLGVNITDGEVVGLGYGSRLEVYTADAALEADAVIVATGTARKAPKIEGLAKFDGKGVSYCAVCDGFFCRGKDVAVLGSGDYALHEAAELRPIASSVTLLTNGEQPPENAPDWLKINTRVVSAFVGETILDTVVFGDGERLPIFRVFVAVGTAGSADLARKAGAVIDGNKIAVDPSMATNVPGLFACGDCIGGLAQVAKAVHEGAVAGMSAAKFARSGK